MMKLPAAVICLLAVLICGFTNASAPMTLTDATFQTELEKGDTMMGFFWAPWCGPCRMIAPMLDELVEEYDGKLKIYKLNTDENPVIPVTYGVYSIPTLLFFKMGQVVDTVLGAQPKSKIANIIDHLM
ncbi:thioredoxin 1-like isoform X2 [Apostichopus japonicus]|uniref:thioredoxin 1-like isoform X2 n=1 Tax=Stichopus japonicus TaxID=307972 RepID=UPI003AB61A9D